MSWAMCAGGPSALRQAVRMALVALGCERGSLSRLRLLARTVPTVPSSALPCALAPLHCPQAVRIALDVKKQLVDTGRLDITQVDGRVGRGGGVGGEHPAEAEGLRSGRPWLGLLPPPTARAHALCMPPSPSPLNPVKLRPRAPLFLSPLPSTLVLRRS